MDPYLSYRAADIWAQNYGCIAQFPYDSMVFLLVYLWHYNNIILIIT